MAEDTDVCGQRRHEPCIIEGHSSEGVILPRLGHPRTRVAFLGGRESWQRNQTSRVPKSVPHEASSTGPCASCLSGVACPSPPFRARRETTVFLACRPAILRRCAQRSKSAGSSSSIRLV